MEPLFLTLMNIAWSSEKPVTPPPFFSFRGPPKMQFLDGQGTNHSDYSNLVELRCVTITRDDVFQDIINYHKVCKKCFMAVSPNYKQQYMLIPPHNLVHKNSAHHQTTCTICSIKILRVNPAWACLYCLEEYLHVDMTYLVEGWGRPVTTLHQIRPERLTLPRYWWSGG